MTAKFCNVMYESMIQSLFVHQIVSMSPSLLLFIIWLVSTQGCPEGWESIPEHDPGCYLVITDNKLQWSDAKQYCENLNAKLFLPTNFEIETKVWNLYQSKGDVMDRLWIDAIALDSSNPFPMIFCFLGRKEKFFLRDKLP